MPELTKSHRSWFLKELLKPAFAINYLNAAAEDSQEMVLIALRNMAEAHRMAKVAEGAGVSRESLYRTLSEDGNPCLDTLTSILNVLGIQMAFKPVQPIHVSSGGLSRELENRQQTTQANSPLGESELIGMERFIASGFQRRHSLDSHANH